MMDPRFSRGYPSLHGCLWCYRWPNAEGFILESGIWNPSSVIWNPSSSLRPIRRRPVPAVALEAFEQVGVEGPAVADGEVGLDVPDLPHAGDDGRDGRVGEDPAQGQLGHGHPPGDEGAQRLGPVDAGGQVLGD